MKTFKTLMALLLALALMCTLFVPVFAASGSDTPADDDDNGGSTRVEEDVMTGTEKEIIDGSADPFAPTAGDGDVIKSVAIDPVRVMDYSKKYHLATVELAECAKIKWYILREDGTVFNGGTEDFTVNGHHGDVWELRWNALDMNGQHPAGKWNDPATERFSLVIIATGINGVDDVAEAYFNYGWYDGENAPAASGAATGAKSASVPHTGL